MNAHRRWSFGALALLLALGCRRAPETVPTGEEAAKVQVPARPVVGPPITDKECEQFAVDLEKAYADRDVNKLKQLLQFEDYLRRTMSTIDGSAEQFNAMLAGTDEKLVRQLLEAMQAGGSVQKVWAKVENGSPRAFMRMLPGDGGVNYHDMRLARGADNRIVMDDCFVMLSGETMGQTFRRTVAPNLAEMHNAGRSRTAQNELMKSLKTAQAMLLAARTKQADEAYRLYQALPEKTQNDKAMLILVISAQDPLAGEQPFSRLVEKFQKLYPNEPSLDFQLIDYYFLKKDAKKVQECLDRLEKNVNDPAYVFFLRGNVAHGLEKQPAAAKQYIEKAIAADPRLAPAYWARIEIALDEKNFPDTETWLKAVVERCNAPVSLEELRKEPLWSEFTRSNEFRRFETWYRARK